VKCKILPVPSRPILIILVLTLILASLAACAQPAASLATTTPGAAATAAVRTAEPTVPKTSASQFEVIWTAAEAYLKSDKAKNSNLKAEDLFYNLNDGNSSNDPLIVSVMASGDYEKGHIPGAINIPWREVAKKESLAKLPKDKPIVVYCYSGQTGSQVTAILNMLGYDVKNLRYGFTSWTRDENVAPNRLDPEKTVKDYKVETQINTPATTYGFPAVNVASSADAFEVIRAAADAYLSSDRGKNTNIKADDLFYNLNDGNVSNDPVVLSVRSTADYGIGHIPGAINVPWQEVAKKENLAKLPPDKPIVAYCYTGHTGSQATAVLNTLGYNVQNLSYGISSWTKDMQVVKTRFDNKVDSKEYKIVSGPNPN